MSEIKLSIDGMSCQHCVKSVQQALDNADGVQNSQVAIGSVTIQYDELKVDKTALAVLIQSAGFKVVE
ncbi:MAG: heavy-metal-associated domain-containing protein [Nitrospira sp.]|nr:heavy-metal-associated domain-containing protein [bacterium]MBL7049033.1 heavy-metal-associated domain-containing protein [Nitrospira sp.]